MRLFPFRPLRAWLRWVIAGSVLIPGLTARGQGANSAGADREDPRAVLAEGEWQEVERAVDRGLAWLMRQQRADGAFQTNMRDEPGISGLCLMAFLSRGHLPGEGPYGQKLSRSVDFLLGSQQPDGMIARQRHRYHGMYSHGIGALVIAELYGMSKPVDDARYRSVIERAMQFTSHRYSQPKAAPDDEGGWRYLSRHASSDSDLSLTSWNLMFLRSAKNSGFDVDARLIDEAVAYLGRVYDPGRQTFRYEIHTDDPAHNHTRGMAGAGVLSMSLAGKHQSEIAKNAAKFILRQPFDQYFRPVQGEQYPCYSAFYCSQAMFQMGGTYWSKYYPTMARTIVQAQRDDGSWVMREGYDIEYGVPYMTAMTILALTPPYQTLPIFQR
jgi:hypothetical protein